MKVSDGNWVFANGELESAAECQSITEMMNNASGLEVERGAALAAHYVLLQIHLQRQILAELRRMNDKLDQVVAG